MHQCCVKGYKLLLFHQNISFRPLWKCLLLNFKEVCRASFLWYCIFLFFIMYFFEPLGNRYCLWKYSYQSSVRDSLATTSNKETFFSRFSANSEASASEFLKNIEEMVPLYYYMHSNRNNSLKSTIQQCVTCLWRVKQDTFFHIFFRFWNRCFLIFKNTLKKFLKVFCMFYSTVISIIHYLEKVYHNLPSC